MSGPGTVTFADPKALVTTALFSAPGEYVLQMAADNGTAKATSTLIVKVELPPPPEQLRFVVTRPYAVTGPFWASRVKALITSWIPHCIDQMQPHRHPRRARRRRHRQLHRGRQGLRGEPHAAHKGYVFSNAWVHQTVESMCLALMIDPQGDPEIIAAQKKLRATLEDWIPKILAAQHPDGYLQTAFTLRDAPRPTSRPQAGGDPGSSGGRVSHRRITRATSPATSSSRRSTTT